MKYLTWHYYRNWFWYGKETADYLEQLANAFDELMETLKDENH